MQDEPVIRLLTGGDIIVAGDPPVVWKGRNARALFAILLLNEGRPVSRERLAALLWPDDPAPSARRNLRMALLQLRRILAPLGSELINATSDTIGLTLDMRQTDMGLLAALAKEPGLEAKRRALALYRGALLDDLPLPASCPDLNTLLQTERERIRSIVIDIGNDLAQEYLEAGNERDAREVLRRVLEIDRASEVAHRTMIRLLLRSGDHAAAQLQFDVCVEALRSEYGVKPSAETRVLGASLKTRETTGSGTESAPHAQATALDEILERLRIEAPAVGEGGRWYRYLLSAAAAVLLAAALVYGAGGLKSVIRKIQSPDRLNLALHTTSTSMLDCDVPDLPDHVRIAMQTALVSLPDIVVVLPGSGAPINGEDRALLHLTSDLQCAGGQFLLSVSLSRNGATPEWINRYSGRISMLETLVDRIRNDLASHLNPG